MSRAAIESEHDRGYRRKLVWLLSTATFFEGYDNFVLAFVLSLVLVDLGGTQAEAGVIRSVTTVGTVLAFFLAAQADRIGRRRLLLITIVGYTAGTALTAASPSLAWLTGAQFVSQIFLGAEWAVAITIVVEEFPESRRGRSLGIVTSMQELGGIAVGLAAFLGLASTPLGWRGFYLLGIIPLVVVAFGRRGLLESERYAVARTDRRWKTLNHAGLWEPWKREYRADVLAIGLLTFFRYTAVSAGVFWWPYYAQAEVGMSISLSGLYLGVAGLAGFVGFLVAGRVMDRIGRRPTMLAYLVGALAFGLWLFQIHSALAMLPVLCLAIFFSLGSVCVTSAFSAETFPTYVRSRASAWCRNAFEVVGGIVGSAVVGFLGDHRTGVIGSIGDAMDALLLATLVPAFLVTLLYVRETRGENLEAMDVAVVS